MPAASDSPVSAIEVGIRALRQEATTYVRRAADGHRIIVTVSGRPAAMLGPLSTPHAPTLHDLVAVQAVLAPRRQGSIPIALPVAVFTGSRLDQLLRDIR